MLDNILSSISNVLDNFYNPIFSGIDSILNKIVQKSIASAEGCWVYCGVSCVAYTCFHYGTYFINLYKWCQNCDGYGCGPCGEGYVQTCTECFNTSPVP